MCKLVTRVAVGTLLILIALVPLGPVSGRPLSLPSACEELAFSTEEEFLSQSYEPPDANPVLSDGDLLTVGVDDSGAVVCMLCARNAELLEVFEVLYDLGLDAADVISAELSLVAFSTELDSPPGASYLFTAGDLLATNGTIIPNQALTHRFQIRYDIGLDSLHFVGDPDAILAFLDAAAQYKREDWLNPADPDLLGRLLEEFGVDIWFSTEGTLDSPLALVFLDGDLLSARDAVIVAKNADLLDPSVPAGLPSDGVDFGLDAATSTREAYREQIHFSTEILYEGEVSFTDGDVLKYGNGVVLTNLDLIGCFKPQADFLGLDALHMTIVPGQVDGKKFHDLNGNGQLDDGEPGLGQWEIHLSGRDGEGNPVSKIAWTGPDGDYSFAVPPGSYEVSEICPDGWYQSLPTPTGEVCGTGKYEVIVEPDQAPYIGRDFGNHRYVVKSGHKFHDLDRSGTWDTQEPPLEGWTIHLEGSDGMGNLLDLDTVTDATGFYSFTVPPGLYKVTEVCPDGGWVQTKPEPSNGCGTGTYDFEPISGQEPHDSNDFGNHQLPAEYPTYLPLVLKNRR